MATCPSETKQPAGSGRSPSRPVDHNVDVLMGGGKARFDQTITGGPYAGRRSSSRRRRRATTVVTDQAGLDAAKPGKQVPRPVRAGATWTSSGPARSPRRTRARRRRRAPSPNPARPATEPHLSDMTAKAIELLDAKTQGDSGKGFFLQVEGASIDKQDHAANPCGQIGETVEFDRAIAGRAGLGEAHPDTLVVVTADHGHTSQIIEPQTPTDHSPGAIATLITADGQPMVVNYAHEPARPLAEPHRHRGAHRRAGPAGGQRRRHHRPDRPLPHDGASARRGVTGRTAASRQSGRTTRGGRMTSCRPGRMSGELRRHRGRGRRARRRRRDPASAEQLLRRRADRRIADAVEELGRRRLPRRRAGQRGPPLLRRRRLRRRPRAAATAGRTSTRWRSGCSSSRSRSSPPCRARRSAAGSAWRWRPTSASPPRGPLRRQLRPPRVPPRLRPDGDAAARRRPPDRARPALHRPAHRRRGGAAARASPTGSSPTDELRAAALALAGEIAASAPLAVRSIRQTMRGHLAGEVRDRAGPRAGRAGPADGDEGLARGRGGDGRASPAGVHGE